LNGSFFLKNIFSGLGEIISTRPSSNFKANLSKNGVTAAFSKLITFPFISSLSPINSCLPLPQAAPYSISSREQPEPTPIVNTLEFLLFCDINFNTWLVSETSPSLFYSIII